MLPDGARVDLLENVLQSYLCFIPGYILASAHIKSFVEPRPAPTHQEFGFLYVAHCPSELSSASSHAFERKKNSIL